MTAMRRLASHTATSFRSIAAQRRSFTSTIAPRLPITKTSPSTKLHQVTQLSNGLRVASEPLPGPFSGVGVYVDAGSRYEDPSLRGVSHIIDRLAFKSTRQRSGDDMFDALESLGGTIQCASSRESLMYQSASFNSTVPTTLQLLAETIRDPLITEEEVFTQLAVADYEITELWAKPETILMELINVAAYQGNTLGNPLLCPRERLGEIDRNTILRYREKFFTPERMVVAFAGVPHEKAVSLTEGLFGDMKKSVPALSGNKEDDAASISSASTNDTASTPSSSSSSTSSPVTSPASSQTSSPSQPPNSIWQKLGLSSSKSSTTSSSSTSSSPLTTSTQPFDMNQPSHYTGGFISLPPIPPPASPVLPRLSYIQLAFEALPISSADIYALAALQTLLGGGGSFSAGGPGKGMYSRLYTNVLNQHGWVESCMAFNLSYTDSGLFGIAASCSPARIMQMLDVMCYELQSLTTESGRNCLQAQEVNRAKNQLRSSLLMNLESRMVELEDLGRQVQVHGKKIDVQEMCDRIDALTPADLRRVAQMVFGGLVENKGCGTGLPTVVVQEGEMEGFRLKPVKWDDIRQRIAMWRLGRT